MPRRRSAALDAALAAALLLLSVAAHAAGDPVRGAALYLQQPSGVPSCVSCHGPDPAQSRNNLLRAADQPAALLKALQAIGVMGYLKPLMGDADIDDVAAYLGRVSRAADPTQPLDVWPRTLEFGTLPLGAVSPEHRVSLRNRSAEPAALPTWTAPFDDATLVHDCPASLAPGAACTVSLRMAASRAGSRAGALAVGPVALVAVSGTVTGAATGSVVADPDTPALDFGTPAPGETAERTLRLVNRGTAPAVFGEAALTGPDAGAFLVSGDCGRGRVLEPSSACTVRVVHTGNAAAARRATLQWRVDGGSPGTVALASRAPEPVAPPPAAPVGPAGGSGGGGGGGCAAAPVAHTRPDPTLLVAVALALAAIGSRRRRHGAVIERP